MLFAAGRALVAILCRPVRPSQAAVVGVLCLAAGAGLWYWHGGGPAPAGVQIVLMAEPGIRLPPARPPGSARLGDGDEVIGVSAGGQTRAYAVAAFTPQAGGHYSPHVVNDRLGGRPVTVTYCDRSACAKVYTGPPGEGPLDVAVGGGITNGDLDGLLLLVGPFRYRQDTGEPLSPGAPPFPYAEAGFVRTTWGRWRESHPDTDVYVGADPPRAGGNRRPTS